MDYLLPSLRKTGYRLRAKPLDQASNRELLLCPHSLLQVYLTRTVNSTMKFSEENGALERVVGRATTTIANIKVDVMYQRSTFAFRRAALPCDDVVL